MSFREDISGTTRDFYQIFVHIAYGHGSVLLRRRCDTLYTSGFVDDITFLLQWAVQRNEFRYERPISLKFTYLQ